MTFRSRITARASRAACLGLAATVPATLLAQQQAPATPQRVEITGSSIKRIDGETALPVQVIDRKAIERSGVLNVEQLLQQVSAAASSGGLTSSSASGATTGGISAISLRGLTSLRTLVLINGRRIAPYGVGFTGDSVSVDVNSIPLAAIERVEVLKDGASAVYGSDAVAGVVNFILRNEVRGGELALTAGDTTQGGASSKRASALWGFGDLGSDRFNIMAMASFNKEGGLRGADRDFARSGINVEHGNDTSSGNTFPANIVLLDDSGRTRNPAVGVCPGPYSVVDPLNNPQNICRYDPSPQVTLLPASERASLFVAGKFALTPDIELFGEASYNKNKIRTVIQPVPISDQFALPGNHPLFNVAPYNGFSTIQLSPAALHYPTAYVRSVIGPTAELPDILVRWRANLSGDRDITDTSTAPRLAFGVRGAVAGWDFDAAALHSQSKVKETVNDGYPSLSRILPLLNSGVVNFWGDNTPEVTAQIRAANFTGAAFETTSTLQSLQAKASRELTKLPGGPLAIALGAETRREKYLFDPSPTIQTGDISGYGGNFLVTDRERMVKAVFGELSVPIVKGLEATAAVRWDDYEGVGSSTTPSMNLRWRPLPSLMLRGSAGKGFRAPSLQDLYLPNTLTVTPPGLSDPLRCPTTGSGNDCQTQFSTTIGGNAALQPEKSKNATLGIVLEPTANSSVTIDWFKIDLKDTIVNGVPAAVILADPVKYAYLITRGPVEAAFPQLPGPITAISGTNINLGETRLSGIDIDGRLSIPMGDAGRLNLSANGTYFIKYDTQNVDGTFTGNVDTVNAATGGVIPRWKHTLSASWSLGAWDATLVQHYQKKYTDLPSTVSGETPKVGAYQTFDLQVAYSGIKNLRVTLGVRNLLDKDPPYTNAGGQVSFQGGYDPQYADPRGRFVYAGLRYEFK
ncbi:TonB-dependent receptor [Aquincola sp. S2]|uniref:TonB-dependent receptor n=1 Tax=Pseudaquabacterium terrae TaxID=2732868 RepID=A0ABX2EIL8_9BURK|nr:TonB-dependent receptor [Aquabacterium terrae]NRF68424.1 TonB-dependent receptor [Aquabacterium terrae]